MSPITPGPNRIKTLGLNQVHLIFPDFGIGLLQAGPSPIPTTRAHPKWRFLKTAARFYFSERNLSAAD
jgi:hypothetical protein